MNHFPSISIECKTVSGGEIRHDMISLDPRNPSPKTVYFRLSARPASADNWTDLSSHATFNDGAKATAAALRALADRIEALDLPNYQSPRPLTKAEEADAANMVGRLGYTRAAAEYEIRTRRHDGSDVKP